MRYGAAIAQRLRTLGHEVFLTTRKHPDTLPLSKLVRERFKVVGKYAPTSVFSRLKEGLKRQLTFCEMFQDVTPDFALSHGSIDLCRVAFGLKIPTISTADAPHAFAANRLALPLVDVVIASKAIPRQEYESVGARNVVQFDGVDEVAWVRGHKLKPNDSYPYGKPLIIVRQTETMASYAKTKKDKSEKMALKLSSLGNVILIPRYDRRPRPGLIVPQSFVDSLSLAAAADLVVGAGGTLCREAALQGTPSIVIRTFGKSYVNDYLSNLGFPLFTVKPNEVFKLAKKHVCQKLDVKDQLEQLENPVDYVEKAIRNAP